jgi:8-oxo-dGTP pyrophosphatase MutT (NUDIX family)
MDYQMFSDCFSNVKDFTGSEKSLYNHTASVHLKNVFAQSPKAPPDAKPAAVLLFCYPKLGTMHLSLIKRAEYDGVHSGQISLPGGKKESTDTSLLHTALRECNEELGTTVAQASPHICLPPIYIPPSNFLVSPYVVSVPYTPVFSPDPREVAQHLQLPLRQLIDFDMEQRSLPYGSNTGMTVPCFVFEGHLIWGATAMILFEFKTFLASRI